MDQPQIALLVATTTAYGMAFWALQRSPLLPGPRVFLQLIGLGAVFAVAVRHIATL